MKTSCVDKYGGVQSILVKSSELRDSMRNGFTIVQSEPHYWTYNVASGVFGG